MQHDSTRCGSFGIGRTWMFPVCVRPNAWRINTRRFRQSADPLRQNSLFSAFFTQWVCSLAATPPQVSVSPPPNGGNGVIRGTTRRRHTVSQLLMLQNPHQHRRGGRWRAWLRYPWAVAGPGRASRCKTESHVRDLAPLVWRAPEGPEGTGGLRGAAPNEVRTPSLAGGRGLRRTEHQRGHKQHHQ